MVARTVVKHPGARELRVALPVNQAFALFTAGQPLWWPPAYSCSGAAFATAIVEPWAGGRWFERDRRGTEHDWGRVRLWDPPRRFGFVWRPGGSGPTDELIISFTPEGPERTRIALRYLRRGGRREGGVGLTAPDAWARLLDYFAAAPLVRGVC